MKHKKSFELDGNNMFIALHMLYIFILTVLFGLSNGLKLLISFKRGIQTATRKKCLVQEKFEKEKPL